jgi:hypothetical protein
LISVLPIFDSPANVQVSPSTLPFVQGNADANFSGSLGDDVGKDSEEADCSQSQR